MLLGDGLDSRPFRLPWPPGTLLFLVAPQAAHDAAIAALAMPGAPPSHVPRGCLMRRVPLAPLAPLAPLMEQIGSSSSSSTSDHLQQQQQQVQKSAAVDVLMAGSGDEAAEAEQALLRPMLLRAGFRPDRLSVWALQGLHGQGVTQEQLRALLAEVTACAAFHSLLVGELPGPLTRRDADNLLAEAGLLGAVYAHSGEEGGGRLGPAAPVAPGPDSSTSGGAAAAERWLMTAQHQRLSLEQMGIFDAWSAEFQDADEGDVIGNFT